MVGVILGQPFKHLICTHSVVRAYRQDAIENNATAACIYRLSNYQGRSEWTFFPM